MTASLTKKTLVSSAFSSAAQLISKLLGLLSTLVVARVLTPDVFALAATTESAFDEIFRMVDSNLVASMEIDFVRQSAMKEASVIGVCHRPSPGF